MKEFKGSVFAISNNPNNDEHGKFIFRWDENIITISERFMSSPYNENEWKECGLFAYDPEYTRHQEGEWTVITLIGDNK